MAYSLDLRTRVVSYVKDGGKKSTASKLFKVSIWCVNDWCKRADLSPIKATGRPRKFDWDKLQQDIQENPDKLLKERAKTFGEHINAIWNACQVMGFSHKKNV